MVAPQFVQNDLTSITVSWLDPSNDGATPITAFSLLMKPEYELAYTEVFRGYMYAFKTTFLMPGFAYSFKVAAINSEGLGVYSAASTPFYTALAPT